MITLFQNSVTYLGIATGRLSGKPRWRRSAAILLDSIFKLQLAQRLKRILFVTLWRITINQRASWYQNERNSFCGVQ